MTGADRAGLLAALGLDEAPTRLDEALTHPSLANEARGSGEHVHNQRLEFLGDAVLGLLASEALMTTHPTADEGELSKLRAAVVRMNTLAAFGRAIGLPAHLALGRGALAAGEAERDNVIADAVEAIVAASYLHGGLEAARPIVARLVASQGDGAPTTLDAKSELQEAIQAREKLTPSYRTQGEEGPPHDRTFSVQVLVGDRVLAEGRGRSKKLAEQAAARAALESFTKPPP